MKLTLEQLVEKYKADTLTDAELKESGYTMEEVKESASNQRGHKKENPSHISKTKTVMGSLGVNSIESGTQKVYEHHQKK